jgi:glycosyltransferase involved in cell wall biosynthesis
MRILHLDSGREMRGGQWQVLRLHEGLIRRGHDSLLLARSGAPLFSAAAQQGLPCAPLSPGNARQRADIVHAHDARSHTFAALLAGAPLVVSRRVAFPVRNSFTSRWKYSRPALFLAVSRFVAHELSRAGVSENRIAVVYDGVPAPDRPAHGDRILVPETHDPAKGMALAEAAAARAGIPLKRSANLTADLPQARALIYLSQSEGLGSGILLGMAHGVTVIASNIGGIPELIENGVNGILVPNEEAAVAEALGHIDPQLGHAARETVLTHFTVDRMVGRTLEAYGRVA